MHFLDLTRILGKISLILSSEYDVFVVRPSYFLVVKEVVACLLLFSLDLMLKTGCYVRETLLARATLPAEAMT